MTALKNIRHWAGFIPVQCLFAPGQLGRVGRVETDSF